MSDANHTTDASTEPDYEAAYVALVEARANVGDDAVHDAINDAIGALYDHTGWNDADDDVRTDGGTAAADAAQDDDDLPREYGSAGQEAGTVLDAFDDLEPGDRVLWGERSVPCTVARVVEPDDRVGQALAASVIQHDPDEYRAEWDDPAEYGRDLEHGDVFLDPDAWGTLRGKRFVVIQGPRGGFYAIAEPESGRHWPALFRAVRSYHSTKYGRPGQGAFKYEEDFDYALTVVEHGDAPDELDPEGDLAAYDDIKDNPVVSFDRDVREHYEVGTVADVFDEGLHSAHERAAAEFAARVEGDDGDDDDAWDADVPAPERVEGSARGYSHSTVTVTEVYRSEYGPKAVLDTPAPWETPDGERAANDVLKETPWEENHRTFDSDRKAWTVDADELVAVASSLRDAGYSVVDERDD